MSTPVFSSKECLRHSGWAGHQDVLSSHLSSANLKTQQVLGHISQLMQQRGFDSVTAAQKAHAVLYECLNSKQRC
jgi:hypothetical protein